MDSQFNPLTIWLSKEGFAELFAKNLGYHILYGWVNYVACYIFGVHYYSPIFLNILSTFICAYYLSKLSRMVGFNNTYSQLLAAFFLLHWDVIAWSSFDNLKDITILTLTTITIYLLLKMLRGTTKIIMIELGVLMLAMFAIRVYIPVVILTSFLLYSAIFIRRTQKYKVLIALSVGLLSVLLFPRMQLSSFLGWAQLLNTNAQSILYGLLKMVLTPQPWSVDDSYSFLVIPSLLHYIMFIPAVFGAILLWR